MGGVTELSKLLANLAPSLHPDEFVFLTLPEGAYGDATELKPIASYREPEGLTLVVSQQHAVDAGIRFEGTFRVITLQVHSDLHAVGLTAVVAESLRRVGISANFIAAFHHDHVFVPASRGEDALDTLLELSRSSVRDSV